MPLCLNAQTDLPKPVALIPFWGSDNTVISQFGDELRKSVNDMAGFMPSTVDMTRLPPDVPEGGFPPYVCPSPSLTKGTPYALTGELTLNEDSQQWHLRLYLWQMADNRLIYTDELAANNQEECGENLPGLLNWIFSWIPQEAPPPPPPAQNAKSKIIYFSATEPDKWLYAGLRAGGSIRVNSDPSDDYPSRIYVNNYYENFNVAAHVNVQLLHGLGIQIEGIFSKDFAPFDLSSFMFPALIRYSYRLGSMAVTALGGVYTALPLGGVVKADPDPQFGITAGFSFGNRIGPGYIYLDIRWAGDLRDTVKKDPGDAAYRRNMVSVCAGYEAGFIPKVPKK